LFNVSCPSYLRVFVMNTLARAVVASLLLMIVPVSGFLPAKCTEAIPRLTKL